MAVEILLALILLMVFVNDGNIIYRRVRYVWDRLTAIPRRWRKRLWQRWHKRRRG